MRSRVSEPVPPLQDDGDTQYFAKPRDSTPPHGGVSVSWLIPFGGCTTSCGIGGATGREVLVITEQDRLGRSVCDLIDLTEALHDGASPQE